MLPRCLFRTFRPASCSLNETLSIQLVHAQHCSTLSTTGASLPSSTNGAIKTKSLYFDTAAPTLAQAAAASDFFQNHKPRKSWVANEWRKQAHSAAPTVPFNSNRDDIGNTLSSSNQTLLTPEIAFLGRSNTGKSSLLNALLDSPGLCRVGSKPGKTTTMHAWTLSAGSLPRTSNRRGQHQNTKKIAPHLLSDPNDRLTVLDMPGYGHGSRDEWGIDIVKYLTRRRQLRRAMVLLNPKHGIKEGDEHILRLLVNHGIPYQIVACKCDTLPMRELETKLAELRQEVRRIGNTSDQKHSASAASALSVCVDDVLAVGGVGEKVGKSANAKMAAGAGGTGAGTAFGVEDVRWAILRAVGLDGFAIDQWTKLWQKREKQKKSL